MDHHLLLPLRMVRDMVTGGHVYESAGVKVDNYKSKHKLTGAAIAFNSDEKLACLSSVTLVSKSTDTGDINVDGQDVKASSTEYDVQPVQHSHVELHC